jgi:hypothetical protein
MTLLGKILSTNQLNLSSSVMSFEVNPKDVIMVTLEEIPKEQRKAFEVHRQGVEECRKAKEARVL